MTRAFVFIGKNIIFVISHLRWLLPPFGALRHHLSPAKAGALWVLGSVPYVSTGKRREAHSSP